MNVGLRSADFRREREAHWAELEGLVKRVEKRGLRSLSTEELHRLPGLYRDAVSSLSVARAISLDANLLAYLDSLVVRAYFCVYGVKPRVRRVVRSFLLDRFPREVRRHRPAVLLSLGLMVIGIVAGTAVREPDTYEAVVSADMASGRDYQASTEELREVLYDGGDDSQSALGLFASFLITHNAKVGMLCFALGFAFGLPTIVLLFYNGLTLGAMGRLYASRGMGWDFWAWVLPHGVTELLAVALCGGAGLVLARAMVSSGQSGRRHALAQAGRQASLIVMGAVVMFLIAAGIEGIFRQVVEDIHARAFLAAATLVFWFVYFVVRRAPPEEVL